MKEKKAKVFVSALIVPIALFFLYFLFFRSAEKKDKIVLESGNFFIVKISSKSFGREPTINFHIGSDESEFSFRKFVSTSFYRRINTGDTILVQAIVSDTLNWCVVLEDKQDLISKLGSQPEDGWRQLPKK